AESCRWKSLEQFDSSNGRQCPSETVPGEPQSLFVGFRSREKFDNLLLNHGVARVKPLMDLAVAARPGIVACQCEIPQPVANLLLRPSKRQQHHLVIPADESLGLVRLKVLIGQETPFPK